MDDDSLYIRAVSPTQHEDASVSLDWRRRMSFHV